MRQKEKVTIYDISKKLNISAATVSRALNDSNREFKDQRAGAEDSQGA